jgi:Protein of unknown function (DUF3592).
MKNRIVFFAIGAGLLWVSWFVGKNDFNAGRTWKPVQGQVVFSKTVKQAGGWEPVVRYRYDVNGKSYESGNRNTSGGWGVQDAGAADMIVSDHRKSSAVTVYYNPADPGQAAIEVGLGMKHFMFALIGLGFIAIAIFVKGSGSPATPRTTSAAAGSNS